MQNIEQYVIDYVEGRVPSKEFRRKVITDSSIVTWLQSIVSKEQEMMLVKGVDEYGKVDSNSEMKFFVLLCFSYLE